MRIQNKWLIKKNSIYKQIAISNKNSKSWSNLCKSMKNFANFVACNQNVDWINRQEQIFTTTSYAICTLYIVQCTIDFFHIKSINSHFPTLTFDSLLSDKGCTVQLVSIKMNRCNSNHFGTVVWHMENIYVIGILLFRHMMC